MKSSIACLLLATTWMAGLPAWAQNPPPPPVDQDLARPPGLEPVPDGPPDPPKGTLNDALRNQHPKSNTPVVTIREDGENKIEEYRVNGKLYAIRVTPPVGAPYTMVDNEGLGKFVPASDPAGVSVRPPRWTLFEF